MSLPPGFLDQLRSQLSLEQVVGRKVVWDQRKSSRARGDFWAPCPFHHEKTSSFHVLERDGYYKCFGCGAGGDAITFVRETEGVGFMEAVEILAAEAGMEMPARDPRAKEKQDRRTVLTEVLEAGLRHYRMMLSSAAAQGARDYLTRRGLDGNALERFGIGFAAPGNDAMFKHLTGKGIPEADVLDSGLCARPDDGRSPYDRFRDRIVIPIRDARGRAISLGGRAMAADAKAKYLNGPETMLFDKGRHLYNLGFARERMQQAEKRAVQEGAPRPPLVLAEGYMDVIALDMAGFPAVAPMGTAITEDQLRLMWRLEDEPVVALDGDRAGLRAAMRLVDLALPLLEPGRSLRFALMPEGKDPDDLIRQDGPDAMQAALDAAVPMVELLWRREADRPLDSPERRAALDKALREAIKRIADPTVRRHYGDALQERRIKLFGNAPAARSAPPGGARGWRRDRPAWRDAPVGPARETLIARLESSSLETFREKVIIASIIANPHLFDRFEERLSEIAFGPETSALARAALGCAADRGKCAEKLGPDVVDAIFTDPHVRLCPAVAKAGDDEIAAAFISQEIAKLSAERARREEIDEAAQDLAEHGGEDVTYRLGAAAAGADEARRSLGEDRTRYETAENGVQLDRDEKDSFAALTEQLGMAGNTRG